MWLFLKFGFYSIVQKKPNESWGFNKNQKTIKLFQTKDSQNGHWHEDKVIDLEDKIFDDFLCVRTREVQSLILLQDQIHEAYRQGKIDHALLTDIIKFPNTDYQYRMWIDRKTLSSIMTLYISELDFSNFKDNCDYRLKDTFSKVWSVMWNLVSKPKKNTSYDLFDDWSNWNER